MEPEPSVLDSLRKAVEAMPDDLPLRLHLATMLLQAGQRDEAVRHLGAVLQRDPGNADALGLLREPDPAPPPSPAPPPTPPPEMRPAVIYLNALWQTRTRARSQVIPESDDEPRAQPVRRPGRLPGELSHATFEYLPESQFPGDDHPLYLRGSLANLEDLGVPVEAGDRELVHEAVPAEHLGGGARVVHGRVRRGQLGDRGLLLDRLAGHQPGGRVIPGQPGGVGPRLHVGDGELDRLVLVKTVAERLALAGVPDALVHAALGQAGGQRGDRHPARIEDLQELGVAPAALAEQVLRGDAAVREGQLARVGGEPSDLGVFLARHETGCSVRNNDRTDLLAA